MKKLFSKYIAGIFSVAVMASAVSVSAGAVDYAEDPGYNAPEAPAEVVTEDIIATVLEADEPVVYIETESATVKEDAIGAIAQAEKPVTFDAGDYTITIDPDTITEVKAIDLAMEIYTTDEETDVDDVTVPAGALVIAPAQKGDFGMTLTVTVPAENIADLDKDTVELYYISDDGKVTKLENALTFDEDGNAIISISHASKYVISDVDLVAESENAGNGGETSGTDEKNPGTGVTVALTVVALAGGSALVSALTAKKRK